MNYSDEQARQYATEKVPSVFWNKTPLTLSNGTTRDYRSGWNMDYPIGLDGKLKSDAKRLWDFDAFDNAFEHRLKQDYGIDISGAMGENNNYYASFLCWMIKEYIFLTTLDVSPVVLSWIRK